MRVGLYKDEWYPCFGIAEGFASDVDAEVDEDTLTRWKTVMREFDQMQREMKEAYEKEYEKS